MNHTKTNSLKNPSQSDQAQGTTLAGEFRDRREQNRRQTERRLFIQIVSCNDQSLIGTTCACQAVDSSPNGLQLVCSDNIPAGSQLDLWVDIASKPGKYFLTSEVLWSQRTENGRCNIGVLLQNAAATDIDNWRTANA
ncbi:MAG: PilZ domain-containing protein [Pseudomonadales bacterium]|nr:PilZ domain-containing protein [Pseudomonadales bacterium]